MPEKPYSKRPSLLARLIDSFLVSHFRHVNESTQWHRLPKWRGLANLLALRAELREHNLHDTDGDLTKEKKGCPFPPEPPPRGVRTASGTHNDLQYPAMGCRGSRLGRNVKRTLTAPDSTRLMKPNPLVVSQELLARRDFKPAISLNLLAAAWIQFQVHDWFAHEREDVGSGQDLEMPPTCAHPAGKTIQKTKPDANQLSQDDQYPAYRNVNPQWWDGSQIYGETEEETLKLRTKAGNEEVCPSGHLYLGADGFLPTDRPSGATASGFIDNWWLGLEILHTLFAKEHNAICDHLKKHEKELSDDVVFQKARLVNCALLAKIHTVEWTPGILNHPAIQPALDANWKGLLGHLFDEGLARKIAPFLPTGFLRETLTGIPLSQTDHHGAPFALTEEFAAVYRLHPLIPDQVEVRSSQSGEAIGKAFKMKEIAFEKARAPFQNGASMEDVLYSFGIANPGAITIRNFPEFLRTLELPKDAKTGTTPTEPLDLAAIDILRDRERGVPRYNEFRRQLRKPPVKTWEELAGGDAELAEDLKRVYEGELEDVDTMVGMFCEPLPKGFGFSDTAFRVFILMASRRLKSDRFFTTDYHKETYTEAGLEWIRRTGMKEVILRHHPSLEFAFEKGRNPFAPWRRK
jgi:hypothetical protein